MGRKRLITDSYPVGKRREGPTRTSKGELAADPGETPQSPGRDVDLTELALLRQFDLAWQYGPCTAVSSHWQGSPGCSAGIGQKRWAWTLPGRYTRCYKLIRETPASSTASGISIPSESCREPSALAYPAAIKDFRTDDGSVAALSRALLQRSTGQEFLRKTTCCTWGSHPAGLQDPLGG
ncbi:DNA polymerase delta subunit 4 isoform X2 [Echinops telfairi]|uniref:DNA polymerase delta subunit 4 isoform X2 n=1 Tax=Echinops telfairi TaxID=9371 RepID=A0AC55DND0_ECHTE|nr:DNA polymerase delta subunit 4 isoform X2 [Echinops telfairi]